MKLHPLLLLLLAGGCRQTQEEPPPPPPKPALPDRFVVKRVRVEAAFLPPDATWRWVVSELTTLRADARARKEDLLVTFEARALHVTDRRGERRSWRLPEGLRLVGGPAHVVLKKDLSVAVYGPDGRRRAPAPTVPVVRARLGGSGGQTQEFRLVVKGGAAFRSISTTG